MWEIFQKILKNNLTPDQAFLLFGIKQKTAIPTKINVDLDLLIKLGFLNKIEKVYKLTPKAKSFMVHLDNYFIKAKKKTDIQLMGKNFSEQINIYRETFPNMRLPSGKPARVNVKMLSESFRWFFETYDYEWLDVVNATKMYVNEYRNAEYMYMQTSQYFICKQDKHKVKSSTLADYCDMIRDGIDTEEKTFKEKVV
tara:strand:- start:3851 stop:4441 length:591 start_codon:yes stop_codon:yes gene_type:complete